MTDDLEGQAVSDNADRRDYHEDHMLRARIAILEAAISDISAARHLPDPWAEIDKVLASLSYRPDDSERASLAASAKRSATRVAKKAKADLAGLI